MTIEDPPFGTTIKLNQAFVDAHGEPKAEAFLAAVNEVAREHGGRSIAGVREALDAALAKVGVDMAEAERDSYADQIARSERVEVTAGPVDFPDDHELMRAHAAQASSDRVEAPAAEVAGVEAPGTGLVENGDSVEVTGTGATEASSKMRGD